MKVGFYPYESSDNQYLSIVINSIKKNNIIVEPFRVSITNWILGKYDIDIAHFNWFDNIDANTVLKTLLRCGKRVFILEILKIRRVKIIITVHNKIPHNTKFKSLTKIFLKFLYLSADSITILSDDTLNVLQQLIGRKRFKKIQKKIVLIPHPNYIGAYPEEIVNQQFNEESKNMKCLFIGAVKPYKNIELILKVAKKLYTDNYNIDFIIAGGGNEDYINILRDKADSLNNIFFLGRFIQNNEMSALIKQADVWIVPYDIESSLNSGTCYLAFSYGKTVICPLIGTIKEVGSENCYSYSYSTQQEHEIKLKEAILNAYKDYHENELENKGRRLLNKVINENCPQDIGKRYVHLYSQILHD